EPASYGLDGVVYHVGKTIGEGHFTACVRMSEKTWRHYNDATYKNVSPNDVLTSE
ncbi:unnamed protein product, partial [Ectocarpus fasciculatus]